jgi:Tol biopolymer transport system component
VLKNPDGWRFLMPRWSPDGGRIMALGIRFVGDRAYFTRNRYAFLLVDPASGELRQVGPELTEADRPFRFCWRPDGQAVSYATAGGKMYTLPLDGSGRALWVDWQPQKRDKFELGDYSPDGRWLALSVAEAESADVSPEADRDLWIVPHLGGRAERLTASPGMDAYPTWGSDGRTLYYVSSGGQGGFAWNLMRLRLDSRSGRPVGRPQPITSDFSKRYLWPKLVAGGARLTYAVEIPNTQIWLAPDGQPGAKVRVAQGRSAHLSPDGQTVYYVGERDEQRGIWAVDRSGRGSRQITDQTPLAQVFDLFSLSPDGRWIAYPAFDGMDLAIFVVSAEGGTPVRVQSLEVKQSSVLPVWSPDNQWLAYANGNKLYAQHRDGSERRELAHLWRWQGWSLCWSPTGQHVAAFGYESPEEFHRGGVSAFWAAFPGAGFGRLTPASEENYKEGLSWYPDGTKLTYQYYGPRDYDSQIRWAYLDGHTELIFDQEDHWDYVGVWAPDGQRFYFHSNAHEGKGTHVFHFDTGRIEHGLDLGIPRWSRDGSTIIWTEGNPQRLFGVMEGFQ